MLGKKNKGSTMSDNELIDECIKANEICSKPSCEKSIKLIKLQCQFCNQCFCTKDILPEIHGCGNAARKAASMPVRKTQKEEDKQLLEKKMSKKLNEMKNQRKKKGK